MEARFHLKWWRITGVRPPAPRCDAPGRRRGLVQEDDRPGDAGRLQDPRPVLCPQRAMACSSRSMARRAGRCRRQPMRWRSSFQSGRGGGDARQLLDHRRDSGKGPVVGEAVRAGTLPQRLVDGAVGGRTGAGRPGGAGAAQRLQAACLPAGVPAADSRATPRACGRPRPGSGRRQTARRPACGRPSNAGGRAGRGPAVGSWSWRRSSRRKTAADRMRRLTGKGTSLTVVC